ncbi:MAG: HNH endonuclease, partial [Thaumarchaeota archaeon]|nr:HNH endonuclease [Nitrososphaerota archaeon]
TENLSINHKPIAFGGTNDTDNLEILRRKCHDSYHRINISKKKMR